MTLEERIAALEQRVLDLEELLVWTASLSQNYGILPNAQSIVNTFGTKIREDREQERAYAGYPV